MQRILHDIFWKVSSTCKSCFSNNQNVGIYMCVNLLAGEVSHESPTLEYKYHPLLIVETINKGSLV